MTSLLNFLLNIFYFFCLLFIGFIIYFVYSFHQYNVEQELEQRRLYDLDVAEKKFLKSPAGLKERQLIFENLKTIPRLTEDSINCLLDQYPTKVKILNHDISFLSSVPGISENLATAIQARLKNI